MKCPLKGASCVVRSVSLPSGKSLSDVVSAGGIVIDVLALGTACWVIPCGPAEVYCAVVCVADQVGDVLAFPGKLLSVM